MVNVSMCMMLHSTVSPMTVGSNDFDFTDGGYWRDVLETVIYRRELTDAQANPSTQRKRYLSPI